MTDRIVLISGGPDCASLYHIGRDDFLLCTGEHLQGNPFRSDGVVHQAKKYGMIWTWYTNEEYKKEAN